MSTTGVMAGKQLGFYDYEQSKAKKRIKKEKPGRDGSGCALASTY